MAATPVRVDLTWRDLSGMQRFDRGASCDVYLARLRGYPSSVVVKVARRGVKDPEQVQEDLATEISVLSMVRHPNIVRLIGHGLGDDGSRFLVLEHLPGDTLARFLCSRTPTSFRPLGRWGVKQTFRLSLALKRAMEVASALQYLHDACLRDDFIMHRDCKSDNLAFDESGALKLLDFGLARVHRRGATSDEVFCMTGKTGSLKYMAPEVLLSEPYNGSADVYSWAMLAWEMAAVHRPFEGYSEEDMLRKVVAQGERPPLESDWPADFKDLLTRCWHRQPAERPCWGEIMPALRRIAKRQRDREEAERQREGDSPVWGALLRILTPLPEHAQASRRSSLPVAIEQPVAEADEDRSRALSA